VFMMNVLELLPQSVIAWASERDQSPVMAGLRKNREYAHEVAAKLIEEKKRELESGTSQRDLLSLLVKANSAPRQELRLNDEEIVAQIRGIMFGGHDTTSKSVVFALGQLAGRPDAQEKLRAEIMDTLKKIRARGDSDFSVNDFDSMPYLIAVVKESLRLHPSGTEIRRVAIKDDVLPLTKPFVGVSGKVHKDLSVPAGTIISISTLGYNLNKDVWGADAYEFRPERWLEMNEETEVNVGVYGNLSTFGGGPRSCIGWRFAVTEIHTFLVSLIRQFDFSLPGNGQVMGKVRQGFFFPVIAGEEHKGAQLPLKVTALRNE